MTRTLIFDADGTLYTPSADRAYQQFFTEIAEETGTSINKIATDWEDLVTTISDRTDPAERRRKTVFRRFIDDHNGATSEERIEHLYHQFWETVKADLIYDDGLAAMLSRLQAAGHHLVIATDEFPEALYWKLSAFLDDPDAVFEAIVTPADTGTMKPSTTFFETALERVNASAETAVMIGDSCRRDIDPAATLDIETVLIGDDDGCEPDHRIQRITDLEELVN